MQFIQDYHRASKNLLPPLALAVACAQSTPDLIRGIRTIHPAGSAIIFAIAYLAGANGSLAALAIASAFLLGLQLVRLSATPRILKAEIVEDSPRNCPPAHYSCNPVSPSAFSGLADLGLEVREIKIGRPTGKPRVVKSV